MTTRPWTWQPALAATRIWWPACPIIRNTRTRAWCALSGVTCGMPSMRRCWQEALSCRRKSCMWSIRRSTARATGRCAGCSQACRSCASAWWPPRRTRTESSPRRPAPIRSCPRRWSSVFSSQKNWGPISASPPTRIATAWGSASARRRASSC